MKNLFVHTQQHFYINFTTYSPGKNLKHVRHDTVDTVISTEETWDLQSAVDITCGQSKLSVIFILHDLPSCLCCPDALSMVGASLSGNGCGSPNHI